MSQDVKDAIAEREATRAASRKPKEATGTTAKAGGGAGALAGAEKGAPVKDGATEKTGEAKG